MSKHKSYKKPANIGNSKTEKPLKRTYEGFRLCKSNYIAMLAITVFAFVLYGNTLNHDFVLDDAIVITNNQFTQKGTEGISDIFKYDTFTGFWLSSYPGKTADQIQEEKKLVAGGRYRPLSLATFALEI